MQSRYFALLYLKIVQHRISCLSEHDLLIATYFTCEILCFTLVYSYIIEQYISWELVEITGFLKLPVLSQMLYIRDGWIAERIVMGSLWVQQP